MTKATDMRSALPANIRAVAGALRASNAKAVVTGGWVRDTLMGSTPSDVDIEVFGIEAGKLENVLRRFGRINAAGKSFSVWRVAGVEADFSLPRRDAKSGPGHRGFDIEDDPNMSFIDAARRRDLTINSIGLDLDTGQVLDPHHGQRDIAAKRLKATDPVTFVEDPLRTLRVAAFAARLEMTPDDELTALCAEIDLTELPGERILGEFEKMLAGTRPSLGLQFLKESNLLRYFPELSALVGVEQDPRWHPEGDVWVHTKMVVDEAARIETGDREENLTLMFAALCHDFGKPGTTNSEPDGGVRAHGHERAGVGPTRTFMERMRAPKNRIERTCALVEHHLAPVLFPTSGAKTGAYRRLARKLDAAGTNITMLERIARADQLGRTTDKARQREFDEGVRFLHTAAAAGVREVAKKDVVMGRHLIGRGLKPGKLFATVLQQCREVQDDTGAANPETILTAVLSERQRRTEAPKDTAKK